MRIQGPTMTRRLLAGTAALAISAGAGAAPLHAQESGEEAAPQDTIIVSGTRQSLAASVDQKRNADRIIDVITAEDIGELPDANVAESLQRITGVQVSRGEGQGNTVRIRGLASQVQLNGRSLASQDSDRSFSLFNLASDYFQTLEVSKSIVASQTEGTLGGVVNLVTRRPLDMDDRLISLTAAGTYDDLAEEPGYQLSGTFADQLVPGSLGVLLTVTYEDRDFRQDTFETRGGYSLVNAGFETGFDFDGNGTTTDALRVRDLRVNSKDAQFEKIGVDGSLQWQAADNFELRLDGNWSKFNRNAYEYFLQMLQSTNGLVPGTAVVDENGTIVAATYNNQDVRPDGRLVPDVYETFTTGLNGKLELGRLTITGDASYSKGSRNIVSQFLRYGLASGVTTSFDFRANGELPDIILDGGNLSLTDPSNYVTNLVFDRIIDVSTNEKAAKLDLDYEFDAGHLRSISAGGRISRRDFRERWYQVPTSVSQGNYPALFDGSGNRLTADQAPISQFTADFPYSGGVLPGFSGNFPRQWFVGNYPMESLSEGSLDFPNALNLRADGFPETLGSHSDIVEDTYAGYVMADIGGVLGGKEYSLNLGVRLVRTELSSGGFAGGTDPVTGDPVFTPVEIDNSYTNFLPSANFRLDMTDDLVFRIAAAKVMQRPDIGALRTGYSINGTALTASGGNPELDPFEATQFDASLEYYMGRDGLISAVAFYKDVKNFITTETALGQIPGVFGHLGEDTFLISRPANGGTAEIHGFELSFQQAFSGLPGLLGGLGVLANYTYSKARTNDGSPFPGLSKHTYNLIGYYDRGPVDFRLAYSYRSKFQENGLGGNGALGLGLYEYGAARGFLDASASYEFSDRIKVFAEALNLTATEDKIYLEVPSRLSYLAQNGRRFLLGVRATF